MLRLPALRPGSRCWAQPIAFKNSVDQASQVRFPPSIHLRRWNSIGSDVSVDKPYFITTPIFYVNADPHVGHLYTLVLTDVIKRWQELKGRNAILCTGTDEHGMKVQQAAGIASRIPKDFCDSGAITFKRLADEANCSYNIFIRTTDEAHRDAVQYFWQMLESRGYIYTGNHQGWYSISDETFYPESGVQRKLVLSSGRKIMASKETGREVEWTSEANYHFRLSSMKDRLLGFYHSNPEWIVPQSRFSEVIAFVERGLGDLSISRPRQRLSWGIPVPNDPTQTVYVWLDALVNYLTATGYPWTPGQEHSGGWPADIHVIGKDIIKFHCVYWPAFLLALDLPLPKQVLTHAHWTMNHEKMSKTEGNVVNPFYALHRFQVDTMRYYMIRDGGIQDDSDYSNEWIVERYKKELQNGFGNLANRVCGVKFSIHGSVEQYHSGTSGWVYDDQDKKVLDLAQSAAELVNLKMQRLDVPGALKVIIGVMTAVNAYMQHTAPWELDPAIPEQLSEQRRRIFIGADSTRVCSILLQPFIPTKSQVLLDQLAVPVDNRGFEFATLGGDKVFGEGSNSKRGQPFPPLSE